MKLKVFLSLLLCTFFVACGTDRDSHAPSEWPPANWTFQINGEPAVVYNLTGGTMGNVTKPGLAQGTFTYQKTGNNTGILTLSFMINDITEVFNLDFSGSSEGAFNLTRSDNSVTPALLEHFSGTFRQN